MTQCEIDELCSRVDAMITTVKRILALHKQEQKIQANQVVEMIRKPAPPDRNELPR